MFYYTVDMRSGNSTVKAYNIINDSQIDSEASENALKMVTINQTIND